MKNFLKTSDFSRRELEDLLAAAFRFKSGQDNSKPLAGKSIALVFFNPSLRTRVSMQVAVYELGGNAVTLEPGLSSWLLEHREAVVMDADKTEHLAEFVRVLERYVAAIGVRTFAALQDWETERREPILSAFARYAAKPLINLESAMHHPCQALADAMTIRERFGDEKKKVLLTWAWHPKPLPMAVPNSFALIAAQMNHDLTIAHPAGYELDAELLAQIKSYGGKVEIVNDPQAAFDAAQVVYAKSWGSQNFYGAPEKEIEFRQRFRRDWIVDEAKMCLTQDAIFMHCLPVRRNVIVTDAVLDSVNSVVVTQAENRLHTHKAVLSRLFDY
jgi:N-acetylornithine carbamoyltransferase